MKYRPKGGKNLPKLAFVGKGITFDTGGICLKPPPGMDEMKGDMGGAANVVPRSWPPSPRSQPDAEIHGIIGTAENMPDGNSLSPRRHLHRPTSGTTVEIINTDAEGRLVLADALHLRGGARARLHPLTTRPSQAHAVVALGPTVSRLLLQRRERPRRAR